VDVQADATHARLTPREVRLNEIGKAHIANDQPEGRELVSRTSPGIGSLICRFRL
jgi:hypothetical protein